MDTVPAGGKFDGVVGVLGALEVVRGWNDADIETDHPLDIVVFTEEEGTRFGVGLLGSLAASGKMDVETALGLTDAGETLEERLDTIGYRGITEFRLEDTAAFVEMHVEQGPELNSYDVPIGLVESIAGITHHSVSITGESDHAGNTPMDLRYDAFMGVAEFALAIEREVTKADGSTVGTVGRVEVSPNGTNVIPGRVDLGVDIRDTDGERLATVVSNLKAELDEITSRRSLEFEWETVLDVSPKYMDQTVIELLRSATEACDLEMRTMQSGAGHDAMNATAVTPTGMLFVPSEGGVSHSPKEFTSSDDLFDGTRVLGEALQTLATIEL